MSGGKTDGEPLRFLFMTSDRYPPFRVDVDVLFGKEMRARGYQVDWLMQSEPEQDRATRVDWDGWTVYLGATDLGQRFFNRVRRHLRSVRNDFRVFKLVKEGNYRFVQVKDKFLGAFLGLLAARRNNRGFVFWLSWPFPEASLLAAKIGTARYPFLYRIRGSFFWVALYKVIAKHADHIIVQSEQMKLDMVNAGVPAEKMTAVPMGFEATDQEPTGTNPVIAHQMIYLGTLLKTRQLSILVRVLGKVRETIPDATLLYVGPEELPGDAAVLEKEAERLGLSDAVTITGRMPREEAFKRVAESAVCFSPFFPTPILNSTSPTKLIEYLSLKKATVANDHPEQKQVLQDSGGGICVGWDENEFAAAAIEIMQDPERARKMGESGYRYVMEHRSYAALADKLEQDYLHIVQDMAP